MRQLVVLATVLLVLAGINTMALRRTTTSPMERQPQQRGTMHLSVRNRPPPSLVSQWATAEQQRRQAIEARKRHELQKQETERQIRAQAQMLREAQAQEQRVVHKQKQLLASAIQVERRARGRWERH